MTDNSQKDFDVKVGLDFTEIGSSISPGGSVPPLPYAAVAVSKCQDPAYMTFDHGRVSDINSFNFHSPMGPILIIRPNGDMEFPQGNISEAAKIFADHVKKTWYSHDLSEEGRVILVTRIRELEAEVEELKSERNHHGQNQEGSEAS